MEYRENQTRLSHYLALENFDFLLLLFLEFDLTLSDLMHD